MYHSAPNLSTEHEHKEIKKGTVTRLKQSQIMDANPVWVATSALIAKFFFLLQPLKKVCPVL
ncbi:hypothetical protein WH95_18510 [Kiloniella litopenaei]|uniref:Uncharacterized protein n=1 Tax=Kiloniella litopenaei TaxID=1549748 RepID=A0A0M2R4R3_9PROT|nr:hypothetical protein WH95_18510 [Kiloniella litopenaei]